MGLFDIFKRGRKRKPDTPNRQNTGHTGTQSKAIDNFVKVDDSGRPCAPSVLNKRYRIEKVLRQDSLSVTVIASYEKITLFPFQPIFGGTYGYIDLTGKLVIDPVFDNARDFSEGLAAVEKGGKWGFIDRSGKFVIDPVFDNARYFSQGLAAVEKEGKWGYIDRSGKFVIDPAYYFATDFVKGLAEVEISGMWGFIDRAGNLMGKSEYVLGFSEGLAAVQEIGIGGEYWRYIDRSGSDVTTQTFDDACSFSEGLAAVEKGGKWGFIDRTGVFVVDPAFDDAKSFSEGLAAVEEGGKWGYIDHTGAFVVVPALDDAKSFSEGLAPVKNGEKWGYIDRSGSFVIESVFDEPDSFIKGFARAKINGKWGFIDKSGAFVIEPEYDDVNYFRKGLAKVEIHCCKGYINMQGEMIAIGKNEIPANDVIIKNLLSNMVYVEGGSFMMGPEIWHNKIQWPVHMETVGSFLIGRYQVTQMEWYAVMGTYPSKFKGNNLPVESVSWDECQEFIRKLNDLTGKTFRLPTEEEWEYAARGGSRSGGFKYSGSDEIDTVAWYEGNSCQKTHSVGTKSPNELGLYDMSGNVHEFTSDNYYTDRSESCGWPPFVFRGGCWSSSHEHCSVVSRDCFAIGTDSFEQIIRAHNYGVGLRLCSSVF